MIWSTDRPVETPPWDPAATPLVVRELAGERAGALRAFSKPRVYSVGVSGDCGCRFQCPDGGARRALVRLLECALASDPEVELFACWEGEEDREPDRHDWVAAAELLAWRRFGDRELLVVRPDA